MGGSGGNGFERRQEARWQPADLEDSLAQTRQQAAEAEVAAVFKDVLAQINQIDTEALNLHKEEIFQALKSTFEEADGLLGGGSYSQHTYVNGISDIDMLFVLDAFSSSKIPNKENSKAVLADMEKRLRQRFPNTEIKSGRMAVRQMTPKENNYDHKRFPAATRPAAAYPGLPDYPVPLCRG
jgi:hypothetical protein